VRQRNSALTADVISSTTMDMGISSGVAAPMSRPMGVNIRFRLSGWTPAPQTVHRPQALCCRSDKADVREAVSTAQRSSLALFHELVMAAMGILVSDLFETRVNLNDLMGEEAIVSPVPLFWQFHRSGSGSYLELLGGFVWHLETRSKSRILCRMDSKRLASCAALMSEEFL
jgi:hypothetical protein